MRLGLIVAILVMPAAASVFAASQGTLHSITLPPIKTELKAGEGKEKVEGLCSICHSLDYITTQPKFPRTQWASTVNKMIKVYGAPISEDDAKKIVQYIVASYGTGN